MDASLGLLVEGMTLAKSIAELFGVLETIDSKVDRLMESELKTGMLELQQAAISNTESVELLRSARQRFNKAIGEIAINLMIATKAFDRATKTFR